MFARAARLYGTSFVRCLPLAVLGAVAAAAVSSYASARTSALASHLLAIMNEAVSRPDNAFAALDDVVTQATAALRSLWQSPSFWFSIAGTLLVVLAFHGALIARQSAGVRPPTRSTATAPSGSPGWLEVTLRRLPSLLLTVAILTLVAAGAWLLIVLVSALGGAAALGVGAFIVIVGTWLWGRLQLWLVAMFARDLGAFAALRASWRLVRGQWWRVSTLITLAYLAVFLITALAQVLSGVLGDGAAPGTLLLGRLLPLLSAALTLPVLPAVWLELYRELREATRALDRGGSGTAGPEAAQTRD